MDKEELYYDFLDWMEFLLKLLKLISRQNGKFYLHTIYGKKLENLSEIGIE